MPMMIEDALPEQLTLKPQLLPYWWYGFILVVLFAVTILRIPEDMVTPVDGQKARWFAGSALVVFLTVAVMRLRTPTRLDVDGFVDAQGRRHAWKDCSEFEVDETKVGGIVLSEVKTTSSEIRVGVWGNFGMPNAELAILLNRFRARALGVKA